MKWKIIKIDYDDKTIFKLLRGYSEGYFYGDSWRLNSGITDISVTKNGEEKLYTIHGYSGSSYMVGSNSEGMLMIMQDILEELRCRYPEATFSLSSVEEFFYDRG